MRLQLSHKKRNFPSTPDGILPLVRGMVFAFFLTGHKQYKGNVPRLKWLWLVRWFSPAGEYQLLRIFFLKCSFVS
jgi:hypothetical protein